MVEVKDLNERKTWQEPVREQEEAGWFHICSQGLEGVDLFPDEKAFITGVNKFAAAFKLFGEDIEVAILVLVSTHFHSLAWGGEPMWSGVRKDSRKQSVCTIPTASALRK